jgi:hypothetical protein
MSYTAPVVNYEATAGGSFTTIDNVLSVNIKRGRQRFQDPLSQTVMTVEMIPTETTTFSVGQLIDCRDANTDVSPCYFQGRITDVQRSYAFPYNSVTGATPADRITITATGGTGVIGTAQLNSETWTAQLVSDTIYALLINQGMAFGDFRVNSVRNSAQTFTGGLLEAVNQLCNTAQYTLDDYVIERIAGKLGVTFFPSGQNFKTVIFTDLGSGYAYTGLEFLSSFQNTFNWVEVNATGVYTSVTALGAAPFNALVYKTFNENLADTSNLSAYLYALLSGQTDPVPFSISTNTMAAPTCMELAQVPSDSLANAIIGQSCAVAFRGSSGTGTIVGVNSAFYPDRGSVQVYLSPSLGTPFTLDLAAFGLLDTNRLGFP